LTSALVDRVAHVIDCRKIAGGADREVVSDQTAAESSDQMLVVVAGRVCASIMDLYRRPDQA
jgi:hypothetical protein